MIKKRWIIFIVLVIAITLPACTGNSPNSNSKDQISKGDSTNTDTNQGTNQILISIILILQLMLHMKTSN